MLDSKTYHRLRQHIIFCNNLGNYVQKKTIKILNINLPLSTVEFIIYFINIK